MWHRSLQTLCITSSLISFPSNGHSQTTVACPPAFELLRNDEDYSCLRDTAARQGLLDEIKYIPLPFGDESYLSFGGEARLRYDYKDDPTWGQDPQDPHGAFLQRYLVHADIHLGSRVRLFGQLRSALEDGRAGDPSPVEEGKLDVQQAFADVDFIDDPATTLTLRSGRQEMRFGSERLVSTREGPNIRRRFDGARGALRARSWQVDALALFPAENETGVFEDGTNTGQALWGLYTVSPELAVRGLRVDLYYLGFRADQARYAAGAGRELRHTLGSRLWGRSQEWDWNWEAIYQFGRFARGRISAWSVATDTGYTVRAVSGSPRLGVSANVASGDRDPDDDSLETLNPLFPRGTYFDELGLLGPRNFFNVHPSIALQPLPHVSVSADVDFFWRLNRGDGVYDPAGRLLRDGTGSDARYVSTLASGTAKWQATRNLLAHARLHARLPWRVHPRDRAARRH